MGGMERKRRMRGEVIWRGNRVGMDWDCIVLY
jgi:hypothetical protein